MRIGRRFTFEAGHHLPNVPSAHKCGRKHGHSYVLWVELEGSKDRTLGWLLDFAFIDEIVKTIVVSMLDHRELNEVAGLENPTSENIVDWIWDRLEAYGWPGDLKLSLVRLEETERSYCERRPYER